MPIFEYVCRTCQHRFETLVSQGAKPVCPVCQDDRLDKQLSVFAVSSGRRDGARPAAGPCAACGDPRGPGACAIG